MLVCARETHIDGAGGHPVDQLTNIVLEGHGVSHVTSGVELADLCPQLRELHLARNSLSDWQEVGLRSQRTHTYIQCVHCLLLLLLLLLHYVCVELSLICIKC